MVFFPRVVWCCLGCGMCFEGWEGSEKVEGGRGMEYLLSG